MRSIWLPSSLSPFFIFFISYRLQTLPLLVELFTREKYLLLLLLLLLSREDYSDARRAAMFISDRQFFFFLPMERFARIIGEGGGTERGKGGGGGDL